MTTEHKRRTEQAKLHAPATPYNPRSHEEPWQKRRRADQAEYHQRRPMPAASGLTTKQVIQGLKNPHG
jgi:hypothetical protein